MVNRSVKILFIDDNEANNALTDAIIEAEELPINRFFALSIDEAVAQLCSFEKEGSFPQLIFSDINLPIKDGYYFAQYYFNHFYENHKAVKMYFMSAGFQQKEYDQLIRFPFVFDIFTKPFSNEIFDRAIEDNLDRSNP